MLNLSRMALKVAEMATTNQVDMWLSFEHSVLAIECRCEYKGLRYAVRVPLDIDALDYTKATDVSHTVIKADQAIQELTNVVMEVIQCTPNS